MDANSKPMAKAVQQPGELPIQRDEQENAAQDEQNYREEENQATHSAQQFIDKRTEKEKKEDDNAVYYVIEQMMIEDNKKKEDEMKKKQSKEKPVVEQQTKIQPQEPPVDECSMKMEPQDLCIKRKRKGHAFSRRRHIYRRRSIALLEPNTSKAAGKNENMEFYTDDEESEENPKIKTKDKSGEGGSSRKIKIIKPQSTDDFSKFQ